MSHVTMALQTSSCD